ncbi:MAG: hypothetical protein R3Y21_05300 [Mycoplasmatota bacterium]
MKKIVLFLLLSILLTGCSVVRIDTDNIDNIVNVVLSKDNELYNRVGSGYKYYIPRGVIYIDSSDLNDKLYSNGNYYYLYIDAISYYYKNECTYEENNESYYSKEITSNDKCGYIEINEVDGNYLIEFMYNYSKIEALVQKEDINDVVLNASYILSTVKFNNDIINLMLDEEFFTEKEERYDIFESNQESSNFLGIVEEE